MKSFLTEIITLINARALSNLVTLKTLNARKIRKILTVLNALTELPEVDSPSLELSELGITSSTIDSNTINASNRFILSPTYPI